MRSAIILFGESIKMVLGGLKSWMWAVMLYYINMLYFSSALCTGLYNYCIVIIIFQTEIRIVDFFLYKEKPLGLSGFFTYLKALWMLLCVPLVICSNIIVFMVFQVLTAGVLDTALLHSCFVVTVRRVF